MNIYVPPTGPLLAMAEAILADVQAGKITTLAFVAVSQNGGIGTQAVGVQATELYLGADILKSNILAAMQSRGPGIMKA